MKIELTITIRIRIRIIYYKNSMASTSRLQTKKKQKSIDIYSHCLLTRRVPIDITLVGGEDVGIKQTLEKIIVQEIGNKCIVEGYVRSDSIRILSYSSGQCIESNIMFEVIVECDICCPVEGMHIPCVVQEITETAGIRAETENKPSPVVIYVARDHHINSKLLPTVKIGDNIKVRVIGQRFELNDKYVSVIAELIEDKMQKPKLVIEES